MDEEHRDVVAHEVPVAEDLRAVLERIDAIPANEGWTEQHPHRSREGLVLNGMRRRHWAL